MKANDIRVLLVDDHFIVRRGLTSSLSIEPDICVVGEASKGDEVTDLYRQHRPDVVMMDWSLARITGPEVTAALRKEFPDAKVLMISALEGDEHIHTAFQAGALGYVFKSAARDEILKAIRAVARSACYVPPGVAERLAERRRRGDVSPREREVLAKIAAGLSNKQIGEALNITEGTVKIHITHILTKLDARDRAHAATIAIRHGLVRFDLD